MISHHPRSIVNARLHIGTGEPWIFRQHVCTAMRVPRTTGRPLQTSGLIEMSSDMILR